MRSAWISLCFLVVTLAMTLAVERGNFKTCDQSGFCKRQRNYQPEISPFSADFDSAELHDSIFSIKLSNELNGKFFILNVSAFEGAFRVFLDEFNPLKLRYRIPVGNTILEDFTPQPLDLVRDPTLKVITLQNSQGNKMVVHCKPVLIDIYFQTELVFRINQKGLLNMEHLREKGEGDSDGTDAWEETFKGHTDSKPNGPVSIGLDVTMIGFEYGYGLAEHSDSHALKDTTNSEPYRLYNLDVFEYELDSRMALYGSVPLLWSSNGNHSVGVFWNNPSETWVDMSFSSEQRSTLDKLLNLFSSTSHSETIPEIQSHWMSESGVLDAFFFLSTSPRDAFRQYSLLTGVTTLPPMFALGYHQCRWNYNDEKDLLTVHKKFDEYVIPYDAIWLDIEHTNGKRYFTWDSEKFPDPDKMIGKLSETSRKLVTVIDPHIKVDDNWNLYKEVRDLDLCIKSVDGKVYNGWCWPGSSVYPDFLNPKTRDWWSQQFLHRKTANQPDNVFTWNDMNEPSVFNGPEVTMHKDAIHYEGWEHRDVHNLYSLQVQRSSWNGHLLASNGKQRPFVLARGFFAGSQRYGSIWTGDNKADWEHLRASIPMVNGLSICGITHSGADIGGFFGNPDSELLTRWYQLGAYHPFFRAHAHIDSRRREPWTLEKPYVDIIRSAIQQRYRLLPYWYHQFFVAEVEKLPVVTSLWFQFPDVKEAYTVEDQFMIGNALLAKPVQEAGAVTSMVYLPSGVWYRQDSWKRFAGRSNNAISLTLEDIPIFYRGGYIVPRKERIRRSSALMHNDPYTLIVALDDKEDAKGYIYIDDGKSYQYRDNKHYLLAEMSFHGMVLKSKLLNNQYSTVNRIERITIVGLSKEPLLVKNNGNSMHVQFTYSHGNQVLTLRDPGVKVNEAWQIEVVLRGKRKFQGEL